METNIHTQSPSQAASLAFGTTMVPYPPLPLRAFMLALLLLGGVMLLELLGAHLQPISAGLYFNLRILLSLSAVVLTLLIFGVGWISTGPPQTRLNVLVAGAFLVVGLFELLHVMPLGAANPLNSLEQRALANLFLLAARLMGALALLLIVFYPVHGLSQPSMRRSVLAVSMATVLATAWFGAHYAPQLAPLLNRCQSTHLFRVALELVINGILAYAAIALIAGRQMRMRLSQSHVLAALIILTVSGLSCLLATRQHDLLMLLGDGYRTLAYGFVCSALLRSAFTRPYEELAQARDRLQHEQTRLQATEQHLRERETQLEALVVTLHTQQFELRLANAQLQALATSDGLTGLTNHRALQQELVSATHRAQRSGEPLALIMLDIDHFKRFNDTFGHPAGDHVLRVVAGVLRASVRSSDLVARYGGEEFAILLPNTTSSGAAEIAERCRQALSDLIWNEWPITASFGVAVWQPCREAKQDLIAQADAALYHAKHQGRNRVELA
ncbi:MAG: diguanylate cyclase [Candidatus Viridilinea halotolerans]|uniref:Diguanylate cyclase n=1 Tax=Candidatus Viridilinea halotolerans TaxID=2491704 RepID=A0A426TTP4_9CHLR|nr:MAG: diguanylate cyclase [Candidatus Viridilinea halotolerans]